MLVCHVERRPLARLLRNLQRVNRNVEAEGTWTLRQGEVQIDWGNGGGALDARTESDGTRGESEQVCHVSRGVMARLSRVLGGVGTIAVTIKQGRLVLDRLSVDAFLHENPGAPLLPKSPRPVDYLLLPDRHPPEVLQAAGVMDKVAAAKARHVATVKAVAAKLAWLGVSEPEVRRFVADRLKARAAGQEALPFRSGER